MSDRRLIGTLREVLARIPEGLVCAYLFGSHARGDATPRSDVDVAVLFEQDPPRTLAGLHLDLADDLSGATGRAVDLVILNRAPADLVHRVLRDGLLLVDADPAARISFEVQARNRYLDLLPHLQRHRQRSGCMTDADLIYKKLAFIETCLRELRELAHPELIEQDLREERFVAHTLQLAIQAALDIASHIVSDERLGEPERNRQLFELLVKNGWAPGELSKPLARMVGFRNVLVHGYQDVDKAVVRDVAESHLDDLDTYVAAIRARMRSS